MLRYGTTGSEVAAGRSQLYGKINKKKKKKKQKLRFT